MKKAHFLRVVLPRLINYLLFCGSSFLLGTGIMLATRLPSGSRGGHGLEVLGMTRHEWGDLHLWTGLVMAALVVLHLALHWRWMKAAMSSAKANLGYAGLLLGLLIIVLPLLLPVTSK